MRCQGWQWAVGSGQWAVGSGQWAVIVLLLVSSWLGACVEEEYNLQGEGTGVELGREYGEGEARVAWSFNGIDDNAVGYELYGGDSTDVVCETEAGATGARLTCVEEGIVPNRRVTRRVRSVVSGLPVDPAGTFITSDPVTALAPIEPPPMIVAVPEIAQRVRITNWCRPIDAHSPLEGETGMEIQARGPVAAGSNVVPDDAPVSTIWQKTSNRGYPSGGVLCDDLVIGGIAPDEAFSYRAVYFDQDGNPAPGPWSAPLSSCTGGEEVCDGRDNNCSGVVDDRSASCYTGPAATRGVGACRDGIERCSNSAPTPCLGEVRPLTELCDGIDNDCDGVVDNGLPLSSYYLDLDGDGYGRVSVGSACANLTNGQLATLRWARANNDCDDGNRAINPGAAEVCNGIDDDCDGEEDEGFPRLRFYADRDGDGYGVSNESIEDCRARPTVYTTTEPDDCNDSNPAINPGALEICDDIDNNCNGPRDEGLLEFTQYRDQDGDGYGGGGGEEKCLGTPGFATRRGDCADSDPSINPGAPPEPCSSSADRNCDGRRNANPQFTVESVIQAPAVAQRASDLQVLCDNPLPATGCWKNTLIVEIQGRHTNSDANAITNVSILGDTTTLGTVVLSRPIPGDNTVQTRTVCVPTTSHANYSRITAQVVAPAGCSARPAVRPASQRTYGPQERCDGHDSNCAGDRDDEDPAVTECAFNSSGAPGYCANISGTYRCEFQDDPELEKVCHSEDSSCISITNTWLGRVMRLQGTGLTFPGQVTRVDVLDLGAGPGSSSDDRVIRSLTGVVQTSPIQLDNIVLPRSLTSEYGHLGIRVSVGTRTSNVLPLLDIGPVAGSFFFVPAPARAWAERSCDDRGDNAWTVELEPSGPGRRPDALLGVFEYEGAASGEARPAGPVDSAVLYTQFSGAACNVGCSVSSNACGGGYRCLAGRCAANECAESADCGGGSCVMGSCQRIPADEQLVLCEGYDLDVGDERLATLGLGGVALSPTCQAAVVLSEVPDEPGRFNLKVVHLRRGGTYWSVLSGFRFAFFGSPDTRQYREDLHSVAFSPDDRFALVAQPLVAGTTISSSLVLVSLSTGASELVAVRACPIPGGCRLQSAEFDSNGRLTAVFGGSAVSLGAAEVPYER